MTEYIVDRTPTTEPVLRHTTGQRSTPCTVHSSHVDQSNKLSTIDANNNGWRIDITLVLTHWRSRTTRSARRALEKLACNSTAATAASVKYTWVDALVIAGTRKTVPSIAFDALLCSVSTVSCDIDSKVCSSTVTT